MHPSLRRLFCAAIIFCAATSSVSYAATTVRSEPQSDEPLWEVALASYGRYGPAYPASDEYQADVIPLPFPIYRGRYLRVGDEREDAVDAARHVFERVAGVHEVREAADVGEQHSGGKMLHVRHGQWSRYGDIMPKHELRHV